MARVTTSTGIANLTADLLKVEPVTNINPADAGSKFAKMANRWYDESRREVLAEHAWDFALKRAQIAAASDGPDFGYSAKFLLPADFIRVATIGDELNPETSYEFEAGYILGDFTSPLDLRYVFDQEDITTFSPKFIQCLIRKLAANMAYGMTGNRSFANEMEDTYQEYLSVARTIDGQQNPPKKIRRSRWAMAKQGASSLDAVHSGRVVI